jgi:hypothetical protein
MDSAVIRVFFNYQLTRKRIVLKGVLKFTLKLQLLQHVSVCSPSSGSELCELAKVTVVDIWLNLTKCFLI